MCFSPGSLRMNFARSYPLTCGNVVPASTMSGGSDAILLHRLLSVRDAHDVDLLAGEGQSNHPLDGDAVVRQEEGTHAPGYLWVSERTPVGNSLTPVPGRSPRCSR
jgi:hypothetical protein